MSDKKGYSRRSFLFGGLGRVKDNVLPEIQKIQGPLTPVDHPTRGRADKALQAQEYALAASLYEQILEDCKDDCPATRARLGFSLYKAGYLKRAAEELEKALAAGGRNNLASLYLGLAYCRLGELKNAQRAWRKYFAPDQTLVQREVNLYLALMEQNAPLDEKTAADAVEQAIEAQKKRYFPDKASA